MMQCLAISLFAFALWTAVATIICLRSFSKERKEKP